MQREIQSYFDNSRGEHHRYRSWEHCFSFFQNHGQSGVIANREDASLQLGFYLASWGMYRGSSFLLQRDYLVHGQVVDVLAKPEFGVLWGRDIGASPGDLELTPVVMRLVADIRAAYRPFAPATGSAQPTDTLLTKVILGTLGSLPACDRYFIDGFRRIGNKYSCLNANFVNRIVEFCLANGDELRTQQVAIASSTGMRYPLMKLADMYFWQLGMEGDTGQSGDPEALT